MKRFLLHLIVALVVAFAGTGRTNAAPVSEDVSVLAARVDKVAPKLMKKHHTPGVSIAVIRNHKVVWRKCYGVQKAGTKQPVTVDTVFEACSMSKPLFAYAVLKLVEQGKLDLDRPLVEYLEKPYLHDQPRHKKITAAMVLYHTTGFPNWRKGGHRSGNPLKVRFEPGTKYGYSGEGFWYLQQVVEKITGEPLPPWIDRRLLKPLKMSHSSYVWRKDYARLAAAGHDLSGNVKPKRPHYKQGNAAYTLYTTPGDYARFLIEMLNPDRSGGHSLSGRMLARMLKPAVKTNRKHLERGLGWVIITSGKEPYAEHSGSNGTGFRCYSRFHPTTGNGFVIMTNALDGKPVWEGIAAAIEPKSK